MNPMELGGGLIEIAGRSVLGSRPYREIFLKEGLAGVAKMILERTGINIINDPELNEEKLKEMRNDLNTKPGMIISNHPALVEIPMIASVITRSDLMIMVHRVYCDIFRKSFGEKNFIPAAKENLVLAKEHIKQGGAFLIFPSGGDELKAGKFEFKDGFGEILEDLKPDDMVYCFNIEANNVGQLKKDFMRKLISVLASAVAPGMSSFGRHKPIGVTMLERNTEAQEWKNLIDQKCMDNDGYREVRNDNFLQYYNKLFNIPRDSPNRAG